MNRLIIIGNGFDICCGLKSSYKDFIYDYFKRAYHKANKIQQVKGKVIHNDELLTLKYGDNAISNEKIETYTNLVLKESRFFDGAETAYWYKGTIKSGPHSRYTISHNVISGILENSTNRANWSSIENEYFLLLCEIFSNSNPRATIDKKVKSASYLNMELNKIKGELINYLISEVNNFQLDSVADKLLNHLVTELTKPIAVNKLIEETRERYKNGAIENLLIINFNYTKLTEDYLYHRLKQKVVKTKIVNIHGLLNEPSNIVFGYGDETDSRYVNLEQSGVNEFTSQMKSPFYITNQGFQEIRSFIFKDLYEISIIGHSLGLSDRVLLKELFENQNCASIRPFHRGNEDDFRTRILSLMRHYENKEEMRRKVVFDKTAILNRSID